MEVDSDCQRKQEDVRAMLNLAKIAEDDVKPYSIALWTRQLENENLVLMEVEEDFLQTLSAERDLVFKGKRGDSAVLCSQDKTFDVKGAEVSNSLLLLPFDAPVKKPEDNVTSHFDATDPSKRTIFNVEITSLFHQYLELRPHKPSMSKLSLLLEEEPFAGNEQEPPGIEQKLKTQDGEIETLISASPTEIREGLKALRAVMINGFWRVLDVDYAYRVFNYFHSSLEANAWPIDKVEREACINDISDLLPRELAEQCFDRFFEPVENSSTWRMNRMEVCRLLGEVILKPAGKFNKTDFFSAWMQTVPDGLGAPELSDLDGLVICDDSSSPPVIWYFPAVTLPESAQLRCQVLFETKLEWTQDEIVPFLIGLENERVGVDKILAKYARMYIKKGVKTYRAKYAKW